MPALIRTLQGRETRMKPLKTNLLSHTVIPAALVAVVAIAAHQTVLPAAKANPAAQVAQNPCAAKNPCNPCAAKNPCAARNPCNPCAAKNPCNPCSAKNPCNPCAAGNPCNPCGAGAAAFSSKCVVPRLQTAAANPCNPCAAKNPCNPCAAKNPCNPCGAANPCNPCGAAAAAPELTTAEATAVYDCLKAEMRTAYAKSGNKYAAVFLNWKNFAKQPYVSGTHGGRFVLNYANAKASAYGQYEKAGKMPAGAVSAKNSFTVNAKGQVSVGPLFLMEKHNAGFNANSKNWQYTLIMPNGQTVGTTNGKGSAAVKFCYECHNAVAEEQDALMFLPEEYRVR